MSKQNVLIIEMDPLIGGAYELFLSARGFGVTLASTPGAAMRAVALRPTDVIIMGNLPDSIEAGALAERMRTMLSPKPVSVVVLSPSMDEIPGSDVIIPRGAHPRALLDAMRTAARRRPVTAPLATVS